MKNKNEEKIDLSKCSRLVKEGIIELVEYDRVMKSNDEFFPSVNLESALLKILKGTAYGERSSLLETFQNLNGYIYSELGYDFDAAYEMLDKLYEVDKTTPKEQIITLLKDFDRISCCIAKIDTYPAVLIESLSLIDHWITDNVNTECDNEIAYILSFYSNFCMASTYDDYLDEHNYKEYKKHGFMSPQKRKALSEMGEMDSEFEETYDFLTQIDDILGPNSFDKFKKMILPNDKTEDNSDVLEEDYLDEDEEYIYEDFADEE